MPICWSLVLDWIEILKSRRYTVKSNDTYSGFGVDHCKDAILIEVFVGNEQQPTSFMAQHDSSLHFDATAFHENVVLST